MQKKAKEPLTDKELNLIEKLRRHPELRERFEAILQLASNAEGSIKSADAIEELLVEEMRQLGRQSMTAWAGRTEEQLAQELKQKDSSARVRKKKR